MRSPVGRASPVQTVKLARAVLTMVTFLSWMANVRTGFFIVRIPVWNRIGLTLRSVGSNNMHPLVHSSGQELHVVYQRVRRVHQFQLRRWWEMVVFGLSGFSLVVLAWLVYPSVCTGLGLQRCTFCWTRPLGGGRWRRYLCNLWGVFWTAHKTAKYLFETGGSFICGMLASAGQPSLHGYFACMVHWAEGALQRNCRQKQGDTSLSPERVFLFSRNFSVSLLGSDLLAFMYWESQPSWARSSPIMLLLRFSTLSHSWRFNLEGSG